MSNFWGSLHYIQSTFLSKLTFTKALSYNVFLSEKKENKKTNKKTNNSQNVIQTLEIKEIIIAIGEGKIIVKIKTKTPSRTPIPAGAKTAANPIRPAIANAPVVKKYSVIG
jgi:hypothetical protein